MSMKMAAQRVRTNLARSTKPRLVGLGITGVVLVSAIGIGMRTGVSAVVNSARSVTEVSGFHQVLSQADGIRSVIHWGPDQVGGQSLRARLVEPETRLAITDSYAHAWDALSRAEQGDASAPLDTYLTGPALQQAKKLLADVARTGTRVKTKHLAHRIAVTFNSDDGAIVGITIRQRRAVRTTTSASGHQSLMQNTESFRVVMVDEDGLWRMKLLERTAFGEPEKSAVTR